MIVIDRLSLKQRLLSGFMFVALLTLLIASGALVALSRIGGNTANTTEQVSKNVDHQIQETEYIVELQKLLERIDQIRTDEAAAARNALTELSAQTAFNESETRQALGKSLKELLNRRIQNRTALDALQSQNRKISKRSAQMALLVTEMADRIKTQTELSISDAFQTARLGADANSEKLEEHFTKIADTTGASLDQVKTALSIRTLSYELNALIKSILLMNDEAEVKYAQGQLLTLTANLETETQLLPESDAITSIQKAIQQLKEDLPELCTLQLLEIYANEPGPPVTTEQVKLISKRLNTINKAGTETADDVGFNALIAIEDAVEAAKTLATENTEGSTAAFTAIQEATRKAVNQTKAAMEIRALSFELSADLNIIMQAETISQIEAEAKTLENVFHAVTEKLDTIQEMDARITTEFNQLKTDGQNLIEARSEAVQSEQQLNKGMAEAVKSLSNQNLALLDDARALKQSMKTGMEENAQFIKGWSGSLMTLAVITLAVAFAIGLILPISVARIMHNSVISLNQSSEEVLMAADQVSEASQSLAEGATEQSASLQETSASLEEMSAMTRHNADNARQATMLADTAKKSANNGHDAMQRMSSAIEQIQDSANETAKIMKVIDEIAFQTNLLALNAAVEAARAGEAGKGFAVVAEEVRSLAMRSAEAAKNTASLIDQAVNNADNGVGIAQEVGSFLEEIVDNVGKSNDLIAEISAASQEQAQGISEINSAMTQLDTLTQRNAAHAEESASASSDLRQLSNQMTTAVSGLDHLIGGDRV